MAATARGVCPRSSQSQVGRTASEKSSGRNGEMGLGMKKTENNLQPSVIEDLYELGQVAQILRCSRKTIYRLISSGRLGAVRWGRSYRFRRQDVQEFVHGSL